MSRLADPDAVEELDRDREEHGVRLREIERLCDCPVGSCSDEPGRRCALALSEELWK